MTAVGVARTCPPHTRGFDCLAPVAANTARIAYAAGMRYVGRYVETLTTTERDGLLAAGLAILPLTVAITHSPLTAELGTQVASERAAQLSALRCPPTVHLWTDHEDAPAGSASVEYLAARAAATLAAGFGAAVYFGEPQDLTAVEMYALAFNRYGRGGGAVPEPRCGFCWFDEIPLDETAFEGQRVDFTSIWEDFEGRTPILWWPK